jgi:hypothetical protein
VAALTAAGQHAASPRISKGAVLARLPPTPLIVWV